MRVRLGFSMKAWLLSMAAGMILSPTIALVAQTVRGSAKTQSQPEKRVVRRASTATTNPQTTLRNAVLRELDTLDEGDDAGDLGVILASTGSGEGSTQSSNNPKRAPSRFPVPKFARKIKRTISAGSKRQTPTQSTSQKSKIRLTQQSSGGSVAQPQSEIQQRLQELYQKDRRDMPSMNLSDAPNTKIGSKQRIIKRDPTAQPSRRGSGPVRFLRTINPFRRRVKQQPRKFPQSNSQPIVRKPSGTPRRAIQQPAPPEAPRSFTNPNVQRTSPTQSDQPFQTEFVHPQPENPAPGIPVRSVGSAPVPPEDPAPAAPVLTFEEDAVSKPSTDETREDGTAETDPVSAPVDDFDNPFNEVSEQEADTVSKKKEDASPNPFSGLKLEDFNAPDKKPADDSPEKDQSSGSTEVVDETPDFGLPAEKSTTVGETDEDLDAKKSAKEPTTEAADEFINPFIRIETAKPDGAADTDDGNDKPRSRVPEINPRPITANVDDPSNRVPVITEEKNDFTNDAAEEVKKADVPVRELPDIDQNTEVADDDNVELKVAPKDDVPLINPGQVPVSRQNDVHAEKMQRIAERVNLKGLKGFCVVALREDRDLVDGSLFYTSTYKSKVYRFSSEKSKEVFDNEPELYAPAAGGNDVTLLADESEDVEGSLDHAVWYKDRLYLFSSPETLEQFVLSPSQYHLQD